MADPFVPPLGGFTAPTLAADPRLVLRAIAAHPGAECRLVGGAARAHGGPAVAIVTLEIVRPDGELLRLMMPPHVAHRLAEALASLRRVDPCVAALVAACTAAAAQAQALAADLSLPHSGALH